MGYSLEQSIGFHLNRAANIIHAGFAKCLEPYDIAPEQFATLKIISEDGEVTQSGIAEILAKGRPTVSRALDALEKKGFILREAHDADRRIKPIRLTAKGREVLDAVEPKAIQLNNTIRSRLSPGETELFFRVLETIIDTTQNYPFPGE
jgi:DNA-binding MarR family transcriptional regulator